MALQSKNAWIPLIFPSKLDQLLTQVQLFSNYFHITSIQTFFLTQRLHQHYTEVCTSRSSRNFSQTFSQQKRCCQTDWLTCFKYIEGGKRQKGNWSQRLHVYKGLATCSSFVIPGKKLAEHFKVHSGGFFPNTEFVHLSCLWKRHLEETDLQSFQV